MDLHVAKSGDLDIAYRVEGDGDETVLLVMGLGGRAADWGVAFPRGLAERYRVVRFDNRGIGASSKAPGGYGLDDLARDAVAVLDALAVERAHVIGISMGGMIAQLLGLDHAHRVDRLVLLSTHYGGFRLVPPHPDALALFDPATFLARGADPAAMMRHTLSVITAPGFVTRAPEAVEALLSYVRAQPTRPASFMAQLQAIFLSDRSERVRAITRPTLIVHGTHDKLVPVENGKNLAARIEGARLVLLEECGHMPMWEKPEALTRVIVDFLAAN